MTAGCPASPSGTLRADLHVHSHHSGFTRTMPMFRSRDCYSTPEEIYRAAKARGMDLVTITDHDSIDGCLELLDRHPDASDIFIGEEIECRLPDCDVRLHMGAFGMTEALHRDIQPLRGNVFELAAMLRANGVALVLHHPFHFFRGGLPVREYLDGLVPLVHAVEIRNAAMSRKHNLFADEIAGERRRAPQGQALGTTGGSDAHVVLHVGTAYTEAPGRTRDDFLAALKAGETRGGGAHGTIPLLAIEIYGVMLNYYASLLGFRRNGLTRFERVRGAALSVASLPFQFVPLVVSLAQKGGEDRRIARWREELSRSTT
jgi:predicted metal-dependent phosphoesterase TrpH